MVTPSPTRTYITKSRVKSSQSTRLPQAAYIAYTVAANGTNTSMLMATFWYRFSTRLVCPVVSLRNGSAVSFRDIILYFPRAASGVYLLEFDGPTGFSPRVPARG